MLAWIVLAGAQAVNASGGTATYYIDSKKGNDKNNGRQQGSPWKTLARLQKTSLYPGDSVLFKRGSHFTGPLRIANSGSPGNYITISDYGPVKEPSPAFTNPVFAENNYGNCIRIGGSYVIVEKLYFSGTPAYSDVCYTGGGWVVWEMGAIHIDSGATHCIIRNNEIKDCVAGIRSNGEYALIEHNYIHDCNRVLKKWNWGPLGIWIGADHQEVRYNRIFNYSAVDPHIGWGPDAYGSGADGGAMEIDDARHDKSDIAIHHNYTRDCQGFLEVTWTDVRQKPAYRNFQIHHNVSDDYQQFIALWRGEGCHIENNTIIRRKVNANEWGVFNITQGRSRNFVRNNIVVTEKNVVIFNTGRRGVAHPQTIISNNLYYAASDSLHMGKEGPGEDAVFGNPLFRNYINASKAEDFAIGDGSPAFLNGKGMPAIGAFDHPETAEAAPTDFVFAGNGKALATIVIPQDASVTHQFAATELGRYLQKMSGAVFAVGKTSVQATSRIIIRLNKGLSTEDYSIALQKKDLVLEAGSDRATLYAVYDLLHRMGCIWLAPAFDFYKGQEEYVPYTATLRYSAAVPVNEHPQFSYRKLDVEEGQSHTIENLRQLIEWMPKVRLNVFMTPLDYQGNGRVKWDNWRKDLVPELKKRGIMIEVGGHGYQNFINAQMEGGELFRNHPEWFGKNAKGQPDSSQYLVFNTADRQATSYFINNIVKYLDGHPEIDIFDCWPPDGARWAECPEMKALGTAVDRQATLMNQVDSAIRRIRPGLRVEIIAYGQVLQPPQHVELHKDILVDICPINQSFEKQINETTAPTNAEYTNAISNWRQYFKGEIGLYSYYRKYAWRSLPVILPHYMQHELKWYDGLPLQGISTYAEPGDWYTYELNHYILAALAWNPEIPVDTMMKRYASFRYGSASREALAAYTDLEKVVKNYGSLPYTPLKSFQQLSDANSVLRQHKERIQAELNKPQDQGVAANLRRLSLMLDYAISDIDIQGMRASGSSDDSVSAKVKQLVVFLEQHAGDGLFLLHDKGSLATFLRHYKK